MKQGISDMLMVGFDYTNGDKPVLIVGRADPKTKVVELLNQFEDERAIDIYNMLISQTKEEKHE